jgi:uncharacterized protein DUF4238
MAEEPRKKRQHFVPRLILREFSPDDRSISLVVVESRKRVDGASIATQCYEDYFYGADGELEKAFGISEGTFRSAVGELSVEHLERLSEDELYRVRLFAHYQRHRTVAAAEQINDLADGMMKKLLEKMPLPDNLKGIDLNDFKIRLSGPQFLNLYQAAAIQPLILDLHVKFLVSTKPLGLVVSDHPVVAYNQWAEHHPRFRGSDGTAGLALRGLQWFLPLSPRVCLAVFDPGTYAYGSDRRRTCSIGMHDIRLLNTLQAINAHECVYFDPRCTPREELDRVLQERVRLMPCENNLFFEGELRARPDGKIGQLVRFSNAALKVGKQLNCVRVTDKEPYEDYDRAVLPVRSPELLQLMEQWSDFLDGEVEKRRKPSEVAAPDRPDE